MGLLLLDLNNQAHKEECLAGFDVADGADTGDPGPVQDRTRPTRLCAGAGSPGMWLSSPRWAARLDLALGKDFP